MIPNLLLSMSTIFLLGEILIFYLFIFFNATVHVLEGVNKLGYLYKTFIIMI